MTRMTILTERELRRLVPLDLAAVDAVENAFRALGRGGVAMPPILRLDVPEHHGEVDVKTAYIPGLDGFAIKISPGFFDNPKRGLPSVNGMMTLLSAETGLVQALLLDNGYLTDVRTAAAGAVAARHLARAEASVAAIFGAGAQARWQLQALTLVRPIKRARIWARDPLKAEAAASELAALLAIDVRAEGDPARAAAGADIVVTTTPATSPILRAEWLAPGQHVTAMGADSEHKNEIDPAALRRADLYVADRLAQTSVLGELRCALAAGLAPRATAELAEIVGGRRRGRSADADLTIADLTGTGAQDTAIAVLAYARARAANAGAVFES